MKYIKYWLTLLILGVMVFSTFSYPNVIDDQSNLTHQTGSLTGHAASQDNNVEWDGVLHDSRDGYYRNPGWGTTSGYNKSGAIPVGTNVTLRIRSFANDLTGVQIRLWDGVDSNEILVPMSINKSEDGYDYWQATVYSPSYPSDYYYAFYLTDGTDTDYYNDDSNFDGGVGEMRGSHNSGTDYGLVFYDPDFITPAWHKQAIGYQIFTDRFYNGDPTNDAQGNGTHGDVTWWEWDSNGDRVFTEDDEQRVHAIKRDWSERPTGGNDYFGGDLAGVQAKLDYLKDLGIEFIWFNPFSESPDNHGYSVDDYRSIDPYYGVIESRADGVVKNNASASLAVFDEMVATLQSHNIRVIYDAVINHISAQSKPFQRFEKMENGDLDLPTDFDVPDPYPSVNGAYENVYSDYRDWFRWYEGNHDYDAWWGFRNIPTLKYDQTSDVADTLITNNETSVFTFWEEHGIEGFRLDVNPDYDDGQGSRLVNQLIRERVKADDPNNIIIGEVWEKANTWFTGTMNDGVQNMPFREQTIDWVKGYLSDEIFGNKLVLPQEVYPSQAFHSMWTILGNHDTQRILTAFHNNGNRQLLAATLQFMYPGVPMVYYGDEVGLPGSTDPDCRRPFPWDNKNTTILNHYKQLVNIRQTYDAVRNGSFTILPNTGGGVLSFAREMGNVESGEIITILNRNDVNIQVTVDLNGMDGSEAGMILADVLHNNRTYQINTNKKITLTLAPEESYVLISDISDELTPPTTTTTSSSTSLTSSTTSSTSDSSSSSTSSASSESTSEPPQNTFGFMINLEFAIVVLLLFGGRKFTQLRKKKRK